MSGQKSMELSVESLKQVYAVVMALALAVAIERLLLNDGSRTLAEWSSITPKLPAFTAVFVTLVPFTHGMSRHLSFAYIEQSDGTTKGGPLLLDFFVFFFQSCMLFAAATAIASGIDTFFILGALLTLDIVWAVIAHNVHYRAIKPSILRWATVNLVFLAAGVVIYSLNVFDDVAKARLLCLFSVLRTIGDYSVGRKFYFPA